jgi:hypothetical protein
MKMITLKILGPYPSCTQCDLAEKEVQKAASLFPGQVTVQHLDMMTAEFGQYKEMVPPIILQGNELISTGKVIPASQVKEILEKYLQS